MRIEREIGLLCGIILIVLLVCAPATAYDQQAVDYYNQGTDYAHLNQYTNAIASFDKALEISPDLFEAWYNRGIELGKLGRYDEAIASYDKALGINPDNPDAWSNRGAALGTLGHYDEAVDS
jgi:tetratricopeptide (TPR) repeat protein